MEKILEVKDLNVMFESKGIKTYAVNGISFDVYEDESLGIVGESGSGKSVTAKSIINLLPKNAIISGEVIYKNDNLLAMPKNKLRDIRGDEISMIFQYPMTSLNPLFTIRTQMKRLIKIHRKNLTNKEIEEISIRYLDMVGIPNPEKRINSYPHEFSGGMRQRVMIAMSLCLHPSLIIADEPTTALDVTIQAQVLNLLNIIKEDYKTSTILITHDLGVVANTCERVIVMYGGRIMEMGAVDDIFKNPKHPYAKGLLQSLPVIGSNKRLESIDGNPPVIHEKLVGCPFYDRCKHRMDKCNKVDPEGVTFENNHKVYCHLY